MQEILTYIAVGFGASVAILCLAAGVVFWNNGKKQEISFKNNNYLKWSIGVFAFAIVILIGGCMLPFVMSKLEKDSEIKVNYGDGLVAGEQDSSKEDEKQEADKGETETNLTPLADMEKWTIQDVEMADGSYSEHQSKVNGESLDKKALKMYVVFPAGIDASHSAELWIGEYANGFLFQTKNETLSLWHYETGKEPQVIKYFVAQTAGVESLFDEPLEITFSTEFINNNGTTTDVSIGVYINGKLYGDKMLTLQGVSVDSLKQQIYVYNKWAAGKTTWLGSNQKPAEKKITALSNLTKWTIENVGLDTGEYEIQNGTATGATLDKKVFASAVIFPNIAEQGRDAQLWIGEQNNGFLFQVSGGKLRLKHFSTAGETVLADIEPSKFGLTSILGQEIFVHLSTEFENNNGTTTDVSVALYINNQLYSDTYLKLEKVPLASLKQQVCVYNRWSGGQVTWISPLLKKDIPPATAPSALKKWNIQTVGMADGEYGYIDQTTGVSGTATGASLDKTAFYCNVKFPGGLASNQAVELWIGEQNNGLRFELKGETMYLKHMCPGKETVLAKLDPAKVSLPKLLDWSLEMIVTVEFVNNNGTTTDANIGLYIDGVLYNNAYFKLKSVPVSSLKQQVAVHTRWGGGKKILLEAL